MKVSWMVDSMVGKRVGLKVDLMDELKVDMRAAWKVQMKAVPTVSYSVENLVGPRDWWGCL